VAAKRKVTESGDRQKVHSGRRLRSGTASEQRTDQSIVVFDEIEADAVTGSESYIVQTRSIRRISQDDDEN
jgi:hypothetical protein